jgi:hypothetical protein
VASWRDSCPLDGICPECGLGHRWAEVLNPLLTVPAWSFEHALGRHAVALARTAIATLRPRRFWSAMRMEHPVRINRLLVVPLLAVPLAGILLLLLAAVLLWALEAADPYGYGFSTGQAWMVATPRARQRRFLSLRRFPRLLPSWRSRDSVRRCVPA